MAVANFSGTYKVGTASCTVMCNGSFTFKAKNTKRTAVFFPDGTAGRKPYSLIMNPNASPWSAK